MPKPMYFFMMKRAIEAAVRARADRVSTIKAIKGREALPLVNIIINIPDK